MKKDVIYVDIDDDITSIIEKVKSSSSKIVALVPPKRIGVLQSIVNLKLLQRSALNNDKRIVMITSDTALATLAAGVEMPVAKNLQSKPEVAPVAALQVDDEDVIDGGDLPIGDHAASVSTPAGESTDTPSPAFSSTAPLAMTAATKAPKKSLTIPSFDKFRNKVFLFGGLGVLLIGFIVWAVFFAPRATVAITANTTPYSINKQLTLKPGAALDSKQAIVAPVAKEIKKSVSVDFAPTGKKEVGEKATGTVKFTKQSLAASSVPAGTVLTTVSGISFATDTAVTIPASTVGGSCFPTACPGTVNTSVTATQQGTGSNGATGGLSGAPDGASASFTAPSSGGTDKTVTVVSNDDIAKAKEKLATQDANGVKAELKKQFSASQVTIDESFQTVAGDPVSTPTVDTEAATAKLTAETVYTLVGVEKASIESIIKDDIGTQINGKSNQKIYDTGLKSLRFTSFAKQENGYSVTLVATGMVGPNIDSKKLASQIEGKRIGEIQAFVQNIEGVESVETHLSPFWVTKAPAADKITIKFIVRNEAN